MAGTQHKRGGPLDGRNPVGLRPGQRLDPVRNGSNSVRLRPGQQLDPVRNGRNLLHEPPAQRLQRLRNGRNPVRLRPARWLQRPRCAAMNRPPKADQVPDTAASPGRNRVIETGDPLVRALAVCVRQAHVRRQARRNG